MSCTPSNQFARRRYAAVDVHDAVDPVRAAPMSSRCAAGSSPAPTGCTATPVADPNDATRSRSHATRRSVPRIETRAPSPAQPSAALRTDTDVAALWQGRLDQATVDTRLAQVPGLSCRLVPGAAHMVHLEQPEATAHALGPWLASQRCRLIPRR